MHAGRWIKGAMLVAATLWCVPSWAAVTRILSTEAQIETRVEFLVFHLSGPVRQQKVFRLQNPERLVVDLDNVQGAGVGMPPGYRGTLIRNVRFGQFDADTSRIVIELAGPVASAEAHRFSAKNEQSPERLVVEVVPLANFNYGSPPAPALSPGAAGGVPVPVFKPVIPGKSAPKPLVIIDAGHGGKDPGALGQAKTLEKNVTLAYAAMLRDVLHKSGRYRAAMTREDDRFILLPDRVRIAREQKADVFISLHADSALTPGARGLSIYTLSETASDEEAAALAEQENSVDILSGFDVGVKDQEVAGILIDLAQRDTKNKSSRLAETLVEGLSRQNIRMLPNAHRYAGFRVLKAPDIPSVLIETGFLSNKEDERLLQTADYQRKLADGVVAGLDRYFKNRHRP